MTRDERIKLRSYLLYIADCLLLMNDMEKMHNCNDCGIKGLCGETPRCGEPVRWNCPHWVEKEKRNET